MTSANENYVNELSKWMAYFIFYLARFFQNATVPNHEEFLHFYTCVKV